MLFGVSLKTILVIALVVLIMDRVVLKHIPALPLIG